MSSILKSLSSKRGAVGKTPEEYLHGLIDAYGRNFDGILATARDGFEFMSDEELDDLFSRARKASRGNRET